MEREGHPAELDFPSIIWPIKTNLLYETTVYTVPVCIHEGNSLIFSLIIFVGEFYYFLI